MEIVGSVAPEDVPEAPRRGGRPGVWPALQQRIIADHEQGRVTVVRLRDEKEYKTMQNNVGPRFRDTQYRLRPVVVVQDDGLRVFMELLPREDNGLRP